ncbi:MAG: GntR family transcriptional regulator [Clostridia bacterium]|nr:GntR family transcriptional regulator [Clostridia bacterium]
MFQIDPLSRTPIYEQIIKQLEKFIAAGTLREGDRIPSVRSVSASSGVNPVTILKSYAELDSRGLIASVPGRGYYVCEGARNILAGIKLGEAEGLRRTLSELCGLGVPRSTVHELVDEVYGAEEIGKGGNPND